MQSSPLPCYLIPLGPKYPPQHSILGNPQPTFLPQCRFTSGKETQNPSYRRQDGTQGQSARIRKNSLRRNFFFFALPCTLYFIRTCYFVVIVLHFALLSVLTTHNTYIHNPGGIRTRNPSERSAAYPRLKPLGHWNRVDPRTVQLVTSHYTD
jgi:hypothetical protein